MKKLMKLKNKAFTLVEMLVVLGIISLLLLLFVPNLSKQKEAVQEKGNAAVVKVVESQMELYELEHDKEVTVAELEQEGYITKKQAQSYNEYKALKANQ
ncbi:TPA: competence type IV pilus major pilin ComGC [Streptococcus suis]